MPKLPFGSMVRSSAPDEDATVNGLVFPLPTTESVAEGVVVPIPTLPPAYEMLDPLVVHCDAVMPSDEVAIHTGAEPDPNDSRIDPAVPALPFMLSAPLNAKLPATVSFDPGLVVFMPTLAVPLCT